MIKLRQGASALFQERQGSAPGQFQAALEIITDDGPSLAYCTRCRERSRIRPENMGRGLFVQVEIGGNPQRWGRPLQGEKCLKESAKETSTCSCSPSDRAFPRLTLSYRASAAEGAHRYLDYFHNVYQIILGEYVESTSNQKLFYGAIDGMIRSLDDPYSRSPTRRHMKSWRK